MRPSLSKLSNVMTTVSLVGNIVSLLVVCSLMIAEVPGFIDAYGTTAQPARQILLAMYISIIVLSACLLWLRDQRMIATLLLMQIIYKILTPITVLSLTNPVVISNIGIAILHSITVFLMLRSGSLRLS